MNIGRTHILFHHEVFKTELFLNYKETLGISAAQVWIQYFSHWRLYWQRFQVNSPTCTLMLMVTKIPAWIICLLTFVKSTIMLLLWKMMLIILQLSVICIFFKYCSRFEIFYNSLETLAYKIINTSDHMVNVNSSETSNLDNITNEVPP